MKKKRIGIVLLLAGGYAHAQWDGSTISTTTTNGDVTLTNGKLGIGGTNASYKIYTRNTSNTMPSGIYNSVSNTNATAQYGIYNSVITSGNDNKYGIYNTLTANSIHNIVGVYSRINNTSGNGIRYGVLSTINATGTGDKIGIYSKVDNTSSGDLRYGVWAEALGTGSEAGHFKGDMAISANDQSKFLFSTSVSGTFADQWLKITPNNTSGANDWDLDNGVTFYNNGLMEKNTTSSATKVFTVRRNDLSKDVFRVYGDGKVYATEVNVMLHTSFPDYVFRPDYQLMPLHEVKSYIQENGHLPNIPAADQVEAEGMNVGEMTRTLVEKVEELTLHLIRQQEEMSRQQEEIEQLKRQLNEKEAQH